jgi:predicted Zn-dependent protease
LSLRDALSAKNIGVAYGAAQCVSALSRDAWEKDEASHLLSRVFLAAGDVDRAYNLIKDLKSDYSKSGPLREDLAACLMAMDRDQEAQQILVDLGKDRLSPEGRAVLSYLDKKLSNKLYS